MEREAKMKIEKCFSCNLPSPKLEAKGIWYCPNALCSGTGAGWFRYKLDSFVDSPTSHTHSIDENEWYEKGSMHEEERKKSKERREEIPSKEEFFEYLNDIDKWKEKQK